MGKQPALVTRAPLRRQGYHVLDAATPGQASEVFERRAGRIELLLTDNVMPDMNRPALGQRLVAAARPALPVLFMSGYADSTSPFDPANPPLGFLGKPFRPSALAVKVREALSRPLTGGQPGTKEQAWP